MPNLTQLRLDGADKRRRLMRKQAMRSVWREIWRQGRRFATWGCCDIPSSADDEHNTSNSLLLAFAHALVAPALLSGLTESDESRLPAEDPLAEQESRLGSVSLEQQSLDAPCEPLFSTGGCA